ncbi:hypothetical protein [Polaromonas sp. CG9_12]|nr:hypothetical protein [Polaromonas sp. CG9_12]
MRGDLRGSLNCRHGSPWNKGERRCQIGRFAPCLPKPDETMFRCNAP